MMVMMMMVWSCQKNAKHEPVVERRRARTAMDFVKGQMDMVELEREQERDNRSSLERPNTNRATEW